MVARAILSTMVAKEILSTMVAKEILSTMVAKEILSTMVAKEILSTMLVAAVDIGTIILLYQQRQQAANVHCTQLLLELLPPKN